MTFRRYLLSFDPPEAELTLSKQARAIDDERLRHEMDAAGVVKPGLAEEEDNMTIEVSIASLGATGAYTYNVYDARGVCLRSEAKMSVIPDAAAYRVLVFQRGGVVHEQEYPDYQAAWSASRAIVHQLTDKLDKSSESETPT
jgi:hypothetical protein